MTFHDMPLWLLFAITILIVVVSIDVGYQFGKLTRHRSTNEKESPVTATAATVVGLLAFMLAITFGISADRYHSRAELVREESSVIRTSYDRSEFLPELERTEVKALYDQDLTVLIRVGDRDRTEELSDLSARLQVIQGQLWGFGSADLRRPDPSPLASPSVQSLIDMDNTLATRQSIGLHPRLPTGLRYAFSRCWRSA